MSTLSTNNSLVSTGRNILPVITMPWAHWFLRLPLAAIIFNQGWMKLPDLAGQAESNAIPVVLFAMAAIGEILGAAALIVGGIVKSLNPGGLINLAGDVLTRLAGFAIAAVVAGVIYMFYWGSFYSMQYHLLLLAGGLYFMLRGNRS